ncbi:chorismate synthase [Streptococcus pseudoporcinus]|uniref:Chorismate synthase n=1 Tax=Streptococcus pseudoporcinus TaxID=361101 RepID=A0A4U9XM82_9STRE|nr:chorismate synthase [Streptococcus pseudoporcinus]VTS13738.1 chorismate synthase [Streptococcus pseudoporcinus]VUC66773.1 chorismate synthase [Streptococcus pseudoporcinus]VUC97701.1 chorismate synthase [Streptococcus pseudoporcinus]VUC98093.1 chorismate synthase [Streptococcus pseudoporcinus]
MRYLTAGESHGNSLTAIVEGFPAGLSINLDEINDELKRRQGGYGRGARMRIESDRVSVTSGLRHGKTTGAPITMIITNKDHQKWLDIMSVQPVDQAVQKKRQVKKPRPGHADLVGGIKYHFKDLRNSLERSSARETAIRVAVGALSKRLLKELGITTMNHILNFGGQEILIPEEMSIQELAEKARLSELSIANPDQETLIKGLIDNIKQEGNTIGGIIETIVTGVPVGLGSFVHWDRKLDGKLAQAILSINAFKGVEFGMGFEMASHKGSEVMDEITWTQETGYQRRTNHLGGFEGGVTNGQPLIIKAVMKPIPTLYKPLMSVDIDTHQPFKASVERSDPTALPAAGVVMENVVATVLAQEILEKFPADHIDELKTAFDDYLDYCKNY